ncbi:MAG: XRE family transcriptional regulator [Oscillospiraceae bacterium]|jgi:transcriptional regulator with XRE-family HTH domain|nr:XRE family transcriptional regulator [Oscillospiraceae bacterium]
MTHPDILAIPQRVKELREILEIPAEELAAKIGVSPQEYAALESGEQDIAISTLYEIAAVLEVDFTELLTGSAPHMNTYSVTRRGEGAKIERFPGYDYTSLCFNFKDRGMEPLLVRLRRGEEEHTKPVMHTGQEFNYVLKGTVCVTVGKKSIPLEPGDCIYFDPRIPHSQTAVTEEASFLTVIME